MNENGLKARRVLVRILLMTMLCAAAVPSSSAMAGQHLQIPLEGSFTMKLPAPEWAHLVPSVGAPIGGTGEGNLLPEDRLPAPLTPQGSSLAASSTSVKTTQITSNTVTTTSSPSDFVIYDDIPLDNASYPASEVASPSAANEGLDMFATYNKYAALSTDYGSTWTYYNPKDQKNRSNISWDLVDGGFTGNQDVFYDPTRNVMVWVLRYGPDSVTGETSFRIAWTVGKTELEGMDWLSSVIAPTSFCPTNLSDHYYQFDRPQLAETSNYLYLSSNVYDSTGSTVQCTMVLRLALDQLAAEISPDVNVYYSEGGFNFTPAQGGSDTFYFARHVSATDLRVYEWPETSTEPTTYTDVTHAAYIQDGYSCPITSPSVDPCLLDDDRLTAGWLWGMSGDPQYLFFAWDAAQGQTGKTDGLGAQAYPYVRYVKLALPLTTPGMTPTIDSGISDPSKAVFLASAARNGRGHAGGTFATAGGTNMPGCTLWISDDYSSGGFAFLSGQTGTDAPASSDWGKYLRTRAVGGNSNQWLGTCYAIESGAVTPRVLRFARQRDADTNVLVHGTLTGSYSLAPSSAVEDSYAGVNSGPAEVIQTTGANMVSTIRVIYGTNSYSEMMGYPNNTTTSFWFPWYNNVAMDSQFRVSNLGGTSTTITVTLAGSQIDQFSLPAGTAKRKNYAGQNGGPMHVYSSGGIPILSTIRVLYNATSFSEMMGYPSAATTDFWFPWYNNVAMDSQLRVSNIGGAPTTITVMLGTNQIDQFTLAAGGAKRKNYAAQNGGPLHVYSSGGIPILSTIRILWGTSLSEMMGFPNNTTTDFLFPRYDDVTTDAQVRVGNLGNLPTTITVYLGGTQVDSYSLAAGAAKRKNYTGLNSGPLHVTSSGSVPILATVRMLYNGTSLYELMGYPGNELTYTQWFPWYNNVAMDSQVRIALP